MLESTYLYFYIGKYDMQYLMVCEVANSSDVFLRRNGNLVCQGELLIIEYQPNFDFTQVDPTLIVQYFGSGLLLYVTFWAVSVGLKAIFSFLK